MSGPWFNLAGEDNGLTQADLAVFGVAYDESVFFRRGAAEGPARIRALSSKIPPVTEDGQILADVQVVDLGDVVPADRSDFSPSDRLLDLHHRIAERFTEASTKGFPLCIGGDHSISIPLFQAAGDWLQRDYALLWIDAHPDLCDTYQGSRYSHACVLRRALEQSYVTPENVVLLGTRSFEMEEIEYIKTRKLTMLTARQLARTPAADIADDILQRFDGLPVYISLDIDGFDPSYAPGTGIPDAGGLTSRWVLDFLQALIPMNVVAADLVEVAPPLDVPSDATSLLALKIILELLGTIEARKHLL